MAALFPQRLHAEKEKNKFIGENLTQRKRRINLSAKTSRQGAKAQRRKGIFKERVTRGGCSCSLSLHFIRLTTNATAHLTTF